MMTKQAKAALAAGLSHSWFCYSNARNIQEKRASAAEFMQRIVDSDASMQEKRAWARALSAALPWAAKAGAGLLRGGRGLAGAAGRPLASMGRGTSLMGKGLTQGVTAGGNLSSRAGAGAGAGGGLGRLMQRLGGGMQNVGNAGIARSAAAPTMAKTLKGMAPGVANMQKGLAGQAGRNINIGAGAGAAGAGLFGLGRASKGQQGPTPEQLQQYMQSQGGQQEWQPSDRNPGSNY